MTGIFRANNPLNASILFVYGFLLKLPFLLGEQKVQVEKSDGFLFRDLIRMVTPAFESWPPIVSVITYLLVFIQAITINYYVNSGKMVSKPNYLTGMAYLLITSFFPFWNKLSAALIVNTFLIWILGKLIVLGSTPKVKATLFNLGLAVGVCSFLYLPSVSILLLILLSLIITRPPKVAEWAMVFLGFVAVWYFFIAALFLTDRLYEFYIEGLNFDLPDIDFTPLVYLRIGLILFIFLLGVWFVQVEAAKQTIQVRKRWSIMLTAVPVMLLTPFLGHNETFSDWIIALLFMAPFVGFAFYSIQSKWIRMILHWAMVGVVIYFQYF